MSDGHSGIENKKVNDGSSGSFTFTLSYLKHSGGEGVFIIHATSSFAYTTEPFEFLQEIGFGHFKGNCPFHRDRCFYKVFARVKRDFNGILDRTEVSRVHSSFKAFAEKAEELFELREKENRILSQVGTENLRRQIFGEPVELVIDESSVPGWVEGVKLQKLRDLEAKNVELQQEIEELSAFLPLVFGTGDNLVKAVVKALDFLELSPKKTSPGFTVDVLAQTADAAKKFGFEVTGISGPIKKSSEKMTQVMEFERLKEADQKTALLANTYRDKPVGERESLEDFTQQVLDFLQPHPILLMTGWDLYRMVRDVLESGKAKEDLIETLYSTSGRLVY